MKKYFNDEDIKKKIFILAISGIIISFFTLVILNLNGIKDIVIDFLNAISAFIWGILFVLIVNDIAVKIENILPKKIKPKSRRVVGAIVSTLLLLAFFVAVFALIVPSVTNSISSLSNSLSSIATDPNVWIENMSESLHLPSSVSKTIYELFNEFVASAWTTLKELVPNIVSATLMTLTSIINFIIGFIVCLYILIDKQRIANAVSRLSMSFLDEEHYGKGRNIVYLAFDKFTKFFAGKIIDSLIIGVICFVAMLFINKEYAPLVATIVGVTNIIPFFGPFIGAIPCALVLLIVAPFDCLVFIIMIIILQQLDGNFIGPAILGDSVGLSSLWIMFAIIVGGHYFGFYGMLLGVPVFAVIYYVIKDEVEQRLKEKGLD